MKVVIDLKDRDYELLKNAGITIDFNTLFHGKEKDRELTFSTFNLIESLKNGIPYEEPKKSRDCSTCARYSEFQKEIPEECKCCKHNYFSNYKEKGGAENENKT